MTPELARRVNEARLNAEFDSSATASFPSYGDWLPQVSPEYSWNWNHLQYVRRQLEDVTAGRCPRLAISWPPQHGKTDGVTVRYPLWRMLREPGIRVAVASYNQRFTNKQSRKTRRLARALGIEFGDVDMVDEWTLANGSTYVARGAGVGISGEPVDCVVGGTMVDTSAGPMRIDSLCNAEEKPLILSYNHKSGCTEYKKMISHRRTTTRRLVHVFTAGGLTVSSTRNHRFYIVGRGYCFADEVEPGDRIIRLSESDGSPGVGVVSCVDSRSVIDEPVYDIQVDGNSNFFANGVLVHNCIIIDDPFKNRADADSPTIQERVYDWYMDDVTPRIQKGGSIVLIHTRWGPGDLIGRIQASEESDSWRYVKLPAIAEENDPLGRAVGEPLCPDRFTLADLEAKRLTAGIGFESLYQQNPIPRGGTYFQRNWFDIVDAAASGVSWVRYWDLAASRKDTACYTSGVLIGKAGDCFFIGDVVRGRYDPASRNDVMRQTADIDVTRPGYQRAYFEKPVFDKDGASTREILSRMAGHRVEADDVGGKGSKELRAEPLAGAAKGGLVKLVAGSWNGAYLTEMEGFPKTAYKDQVDSSSGGFNMLTAERPTVRVSHLPRRR